MKIERKTYLDVLRFIAISAVIMIHVSASFVDNYSSTLEFTLGNIFDSFSRLAVPIFLMISGALMLNEEKEFNCKKRVLSLLIPLIVWSFLYAFVFSFVLPVLKKESFNVFEFFNSFIQGYFHLWYMWAIIGLYLITPILRKIVKIENKKIVLYFIVLSLLFCFTQPIITLLINEIPALKTTGFADTYTHIFNNLNLDFLGGLTSYYLIGWLLANTEIDKKRNIIFYGLGFISLITIIILCQLFPNNTSLIYSNSSALVFLYSVSVFLLVKNICRNSEKPNRLIISLSKLSFGAYLVHMFVLTVTTLILPKNPFLIPVNFLLTLIVSFLISYVLSKIPILKKIIKI